MNSRLKALLVAVLAIVACSGGQASPSSTGSPVELSQAELKLALLDQLGEPWFCDPDEFPVSRGDEATLAEERFPEIRDDAETWSAIAARLGIQADREPDPAAKLEVYRLWKRLNAIELSPAGDVFRFEVLIRAPATPEGGVRTSGEIDRSGTIEIASEVPAGEPECPICLGRGTLIATPRGPIAIERLRVGDLVWSVDDGGRRVAARVERAGSAAVPANHRLAVVALADGRLIIASPGHPLADARALGAVRPGDLVNGSVVVSVASRAYDGGRTFDILPGGPTGHYWADGVLLASTLAD
jgi:hypothetical protein